MRGLLLYNENKVTQGKADLIMANRFGVELERLDFSSKLTRFNLLYRGQRITLLYLGIPRFWIKKLVPHQPY